MDPIALDLDNDGIETIGEQGSSTVLFDHDANGVMNGTGWLGPDDAWVVLDRDGDGKITTGRELFGIDTLLPNGQFPANGHAAFAPLDTNADARVDAADGDVTAWQIRRDLNNDGTVGLTETRAARADDVRIWRDANQDGISQTAELQTFAQAGIQSINLNATNQNFQLPRDIPGGRELLRGTFTRTNGSMGSASSLDLLRHNFYRQFVEELPPTAASQGQPQVRGSGRVRDLDQALEGSNGLQAAINTFKTTTTRPGQLAQSDQVINAWAATSDMAGANQALWARAQPAVPRYLPGTIVSGAPNTALAAWMDAQPGAPPLPQDWFQRAQSAEYNEFVRKLEVLERFMGRTFFDLSTVTTQQVSRTVPRTDFQGQLYNWTVTANVASMSIGNTLLIEQSYGALRDSVYGDLVLQTRLRPYLDLIELRFDAGGGLTSSFAALETQLNGLRSTDGGAALSDLVELMRYAGRALAKSGWDEGLTLLKTWIVAAQADSTMTALLDSLRVRTTIGSSNAGDTFVVPDSFPSYWTIDTGAGDDTIFTKGGEIIVGGAGSDVIVIGGQAVSVQGGQDQDVYVFGKGRNGVGGFASIEATGQNNRLDRGVLVLESNVLPIDVQLRRAYRPDKGGGFDHLEIRVAGNTVAVQDLRAFLGANGLSTTDNTNRNIDAIQFGDGTIWDVAAIRRKVLEGTSGLDQLHGFDDSDDVINGVGGNDYIYGYAGNDTLTGGDGEDTIIGGERGRHP